MSPEERRKPGRKPNPCPSKRITVRVSAEVHEYLTNLPTTYAPLTTAAVETAVRREMKKTKKAPGTVCAGE